MSKILTNEDVRHKLIEDLLSKLKRLEPGDWMTAMGYIKKIEELNKASWPNAD